MEMEEQTCDQLENGKKKLQSPFVALDERLLKSEDSDSFQERQSERAE